MANQSLMAQGNICANSLRIGYTLIFWYDWKDFLKSVLATVLERLTIGSLVGRLTNTTWKYRSNEPCMDGCLRSVVLEYDLEINIFSDL